MFLNSKYKEVLIEMETSGICHTDLHAKQIMTD